MNYSKEQILKYVMDKDLSTIAFSWPQGQFREVIDAYLDEHNFVNHRWYQDVQGGTEGLDHVQKMTLREAVNCTDRKTREDISRWMRCHA